MEASIFSSIMNQKICRLPFRPVFSNARIKRVALADERSFLVVKATGSTVLKRIESYFALGTRVFPVSKNSTHMSYSLNSEHSH